MLWPISDFLGSVVNLRSRWLLPNEDRGSPKGEEENPFKLVLAKLSPEDRALVKASSPKWWARSGIRIHKEGACFATEGA